MREYEACGQLAAGPHKGKVVTVPIRAQNFGEAVCKLGLILNEWEEEMDMAQIRAKTNLIQPMGGPLQFGS